MQRQQKEVMIKTRGGSNSVRRAELNENNTYTTQMIDQQRQTQLSPVINKGLPPGMSPSPGSVQSNTITRPSILKPVHPPSKREGSMVSGSERNFAGDGYQSANNQLFGQGYMSQGQSDNESGRVSNPQNFKLNNMNIRKVSPNGGLVQPINNIQAQLNHQVVGGTID